MQEALFITATAELEPANAVAAILVDEGGDYFLQLRDSVPHIFFPGHWGCFGGALNPGEQPLAALQRELAEELELQANPAKTKPFTRMDFDFSPLGKPKVYRMYFEVTMSSEQVSGLKLHEGREVRRFSGNHLLLRERVTPYDAFAIWMHMRAARGSGRTVAVGA